MSMPSRRGIAAIADMEGASGIFDANREACWRCDLAHTIHTPPIESFRINGIHVAEIGESMMCFSGVPYIANIGCAASPEETYPIIYDGVRAALHDYEGKCGYPEQEAYSCKLCLMDDARYGRRMTCRRH